MWGRYEGARKRRTRPTWLFYSAHTKAERAFDGEIAALVEAAEGAVKIVRLLGEPAGAVAGLDYDEEGRIHVELLKAKLAFDDYDFYMCGPAGFMQSVYDGLRDLQVADSRIHAEAFGPSGLTRRQDATLQAPARMVATDPTRVAFVRSARKRDGRPKQGHCSTWLSREGWRRRSAVVAEAAERVPQRYCRAPSRTIVRRPSAFPKGRR